MSTVIQPAAKARVTPAARPQALGAEAAGGLRRAVPAAADAVRHLRGVAAGGRPGRPAAAQHGAAARDVRGHQAEQQADQLRDQQEALEQQVRTLESPQNLADRALRMGMVPNPNPVFLRLSDGRVLGVPAGGQGRHGYGDVRPGTPTGTADQAAGRAAGQRSHRVKTAGASHHAGHDQPANARRRQGRRTARTGRRQDDGRTATTGTSRAPVRRERGHHDHRGMIG